MRCAGQYGFGQRVTTSPSSRRAAVPHTGQWLGISHTVSDPSRASITALRDAYSGVASQMRLASEEVSDRFRDAVLERIPRVVDCLANLSNQVDPAIYPFQHAEEGMTLHKFVIPRVPDKTSFSDVLDTAHTALEHFYALHDRVYARLARIAEAAEQDAGLAPLPEPPPLADEAARA